MPHALTTVVRLIDVGMQSDFMLAAAAAESAINSYSARAVIPRAEVEHIRTRSLTVGAHALASECDIIHIMAHGTNNLDDLGWWSDDDKTGWYLDDLYDVMDEHEVGITAKVVLADSCNGGLGNFRKGVQGLLNETCLYIASRRVVTWSEGTVYASCFYSAYLSLGPKRMDGIARGKEAAARATDAYMRLQGTDRCPFEAWELEPH